MGGEPFCHCLDRDLGRPLFREAEHAGGDAAECHTAQTVFRTEVERVPVTVSQLVFQVRRKAVIHDWPDDMHDLFRGEIIALCQHRQGGRLLIIPSVAGTKRLHLLMAFGAELDTRIGVDTVVDAAVAGLETAQHPGVGGVYDRVHGKAGDVSLPEGQLIRKRLFAAEALCDRRNTIKTHDPSLLRPFLQVLVLDQQGLLRHGTRHADVHQGTQEPLFALCVRRCPQIFILNGVRLESFHKIIQTLLLCYFLCHVSVSS